MHAATASTENLTQKFLLVTLRWPQSDPTLTLRWPDRDWGLKVGVGLHPQGQRQISPSEVCILWKFGAFSDCDLKRSNSMNHCRGACLVSGLLELAVKKNSHPLYLGWQGKKLQLAGAVRGFTFYKNILLMHGYSVQFHTIVYFP